MPDTKERQEVREGLPEIFGVQLNEQQMKGISTLGLAYVGDAVYELLVRISLCMKTGSTHTSMHKQAIRCVNASAQARSYGLLAEQLTAQEKDVYRRGRNADTHSKPKCVSTADYSAATGLETLFGWLWMTGRQERASELFQVIWGQRQSVCTLPDGHKTERGE